MANTKVTTRVIADDAITSDKLASGLTLGGDTTLSGHVSLADSKVVKLGDSADLQIRHNGTHSLITNTTGNLYIQDDGYVEIGSASGEVYIGAVKDGAVNLRYDNDKKIETSSGGVTITGTATATTFSGALSGTIASATTATTQSASDNTTKVATTAYVTTAVSNLVDSSPSALNTLNELAAALGDDANFSTTVTNSIALKAPLASPDFTGQVQVTNSATTVQEFIVTGNNTRSSLSMQSKDSSGNAVDLRMHSLGDGPRGEIFTFTNHDLAFATNNAAPQMTLDTGGRLGINQTPAGNNFTLQVKGIQTNGTDGRVAYFKGYGTQTSIGSTGPTVVIQNANTTANNYAKLSFESGNAGETVSINAQNIDHTNHYGDMAFNTRGSGGYLEKARIKANGHLQFNPVNSFTGLNNSILGSSNTYLYMMGGAAGLYLADNADLSNAIGIRNTNYIDFTTNGQSILKFDTTGIQFQRTDGQAITAKESIVMTVDADNNTASRVFQVNHGNGKTLLNLHDDYRMEVGTIHFASNRSAGYSSSNGLGASAGDWVDIATVPYGRNIATIKIFWDGIYAPNSSHHGNMEFDIGSHYGTSYYYGWDSYITLKASSAHNHFYITEARIITPNGSGATGHFQVKFGVATGTNGTLRAYVTHRDEQCSIDPITPVVNNSRSGTTIAEVNLEDRPTIATSRHFHTKGMMRATAQPAFSCNSSGNYTTTTGDQNIKTFASSNATTLNQGSDLSGGKFTAPVDGLYQFNLKGAATYSSGYLFMYVFKNGSAMSNAYHYMYQTSNSATLSLTVKADEGDYFEPYINTNYSGGTVSAILFSGHLIA